MSYVIKDIPLEQRPRERLIKYGIEALSDEEVIALLIRTGYKNNNAKEVALALLINLKELSMLGNITYRSLVNLKGIGPAKATTLIAALEFGKRIKQANLINKQSMNNPQVIYNLYHDQIVDNKQEKLLAIFLNTKKQLITAKIIFIGTVNSSIVHPREIFKAAMINSAASIILVHNHPSGEVQPSAMDDNFTLNMIKVGYIVGINVIDHIIFGFQGYYSYYESNQEIFTNCQ